MPLSHSIDTTAGIVTLHYAEDPPFEVWAAAMDAVLRDPAFRPGYGLLMDRSRLTTAPEREYIVGVVDYVQRHASQLGGGRVATLVNRPAAYGMARMAQLLLDDTPQATRVFTELSEALAWLSTGTESVR